jgi:hypothetical protein
MTKYIQSIYKPKNPEKYVGDVNNIIARSSWERKFFIWCDSREFVVAWSSEETVIPYKCATDGRIHRYFVDAKIKIRESNGAYKTYLIEIKPMAQVEKPRPPKRKTQKTRVRYLNECATYMKNQSKWEAAKYYCQQRGWEFKILTEIELGIKQ